MMPVAIRGGNRLAVLTPEAVDALWPWYASQNNHVHRRPYDAVIRCLGWRLDTSIFDGGAGRYSVVVDRREAIDRAIGGAGPDDTVVLAGKGHEDYQIIGRDRLPFDDRD